MKILGIKKEKRTICGCRGASLGNRFCNKCGHNANTHNFGKGCRVTYDPKTKYYGIADTIVDYTLYKRLMD